MPLKSKMRVKFPVFLSMEILEFVIKCHCQLKLGRDQKIEVGCLPSSFPARFEGYLKRLTTMTFAEVGVRLSTRFQHIMILPLKPFKMAEILGNFR